MTRAASFVGARGNRRRRGLTLIEILVVIAIMALLAGIATHTLFATIIRARVAQARSEIARIAGAVESYRREFGAYPPDTGEWNEATFDPRSIHRYLARGLVDAGTGKRYDSFMGIPSGRFVERDADGVGIHVDPWGNPYHLDAVHMVYASGKWRKTGEPYLPARPATERTRPYKVISFGPDGTTAPGYPFDRETLGQDAKDDVRSW